MGRPQPHSRCTRPRPFPAPAIIGSRTSASRTPAAPLARPGTAPPRSLTRQPARTNPAPIRESQPEGHAARPGKSQPAAKLQAETPFTPAQSFRNEDLTSPKYVVHMVSRGTWLSARVVLRWWPAMPGRTGAKAALYARATGIMTAGARDANRTYAGRRRRRRSGTSTAFCPVPSRRRSAGSGSHGTRQVPVIRLGCHLSLPGEMPSLIGRWSYQPQRGSPGGRSKRAT